MGVEIYGKDPSGKGYVGGNGLIDGPSLTYSTMSAHFALMGLYQAFPTLDIICGELPIGSFLIGLDKYQKAVHDAEIELEVSPHRDYLDVHIPGHRVVLMDLDRAQRFIDHLRSYLEHCQAHGVETIYWS